MKNYKILLFAVVCIMLAGFATSIFIMRNFKTDDVDIVLLNDIAQTAKKNFDNLEKLNEYNFGVDYVVFDTTGSVIFSSFKNKNIMADSKNLTSRFLGDSINYIDAVRNRYPCMAILDDSNDGKFLGNVVIIENQNDEFKTQYKIAISTLFIFGIFLVICVAIWGVYVKYNIVKPFQQMEKFAGEIAAGNLDTPLKMEKNNLFGIFTESFDIMREELAKARESEIRLKQKEKELVASLSHDLKTPITGIKLTAELMKAQSDNPATSEKLDNIYKKAEQIDTLVNDLLTSALKDLGEMEVNITEENSAVLHEYVKRCDDRNLAEENEIPQCIISIDTRRMEQIIGNIISNSYKYADTRISISYSIIEGYLKMSIRDYGQGIHEDEIKLVTNKFYRSKSSKEEKKDGSGLGLYIAKSLIEKMNGEIRCLNAEPGFEVWLLIPLS